MELAQETLHLWAHNNFDWVRLVAVLLPDSEVVKLEVPHTPSYNDFATALLRHDGRFQLGAFTVEFGGFTATHPFPQDNQTPTTFGDGALVFCRLR